MAVGSLLSGFAGGYSDYLTEERARNRKAEDDELQYRRTVLDKFIEGMKDNPANAELINRAMQDFMNVGNSIGKTRKSVNGPGRSVGKTQQPELPFLNDLIAGKIPIFGHVNIGQNGEVTGHSIQPAGPGGATLPPPPMQASGPDVAPSRSMPPSTAMPGNMTPTAPAPMPPPPQHAGTGNLAAAAGDAAGEMPAPPIPIGGAQHTFDPGLFMAGPDQARMAGIKKYELEAADDRALADLIRANGGSNQDVLFALMRKRLGYAGMGGGAGGGSWAGKVFLDPDGNRQFFGSQSKADGFVYEMTPQGPRKIVGAIPDPGYQTSFFTNDNGKVTGAQMSKDLGRNDTIRTAEVPGVEGRTTPPVAVGSEGGNILVPRAGAAGHSAPAPAGENPEKIKRDADIRLQADRDEINKRYAPENTTLQEPERTKAKNREYAAAISLYRRTIGHPITDVETIYQSLPQRTDKGAQPAGTAMKPMSNTIPEPPKAGAAPAKGANNLPANPLDGHPWYVQQGLKLIPAGTGPNWTPDAKARMKQYLEGQRTSDGHPVAATDRNIAYALTKIQYRMAAGLR